MHLVNTPEEFTDYIMDELGRWIAEGCPIAFKARRFKTGLFSFLYDSEVQRSPLNLKFTSNGYVVVRVVKPDNSYVVARFQMANPKLKENMMECFEKLDGEDFSGFTPIEEARPQWKR
jgi:hypothetical protein